MKGLSWSQRRSFYEQAESQIDNGLTLPAVLEDFSNRLTRRRNSKAGQIVEEIRLSVVDGSTLTDAMGDRLTDLERSVLSAGEKGEGGQLPRAMRLILEVREMTSNIQGKLISTLFQPAVYFLTLYATLAVIGVQVVPPLTDVVPIAKWTGWAYAMYLMGEAATGFAAPIVLGSVVAYFIWSLRALPRWVESEKSKARVRFDRHMFPFTTYRELTGFTWLMSHVAMVRAGIPETVALQQQIDSASPWLASRLTPILEGMVLGGLDMAAAMRRSGLDFPSPDLIDEVGAYAGFKNFTEKLEVVLRKYAKKLERKLLLKGLFLSGVFSALMYGAFFVVALGSDAISKSMASPI